MGKLLWCCGVNRKGVCQARRFGNGDRERKPISVFSNLKLEVYTFCSKLLHQSLQVSRMIHLDISVLGIDFHGWHSAFVISSQRLGNMIGGYAPLLVVIVKEPD